MTNDKELLKLCEDVIRAHCTGVDAVMRIPFITQETLARALKSRIENQSTVADENRLRLDAEETECVHTCLDDRGIARADDSGKAYSLWGRVCRYAEIENQAVADGEIWSFLRSVLEQGAAIQQDYVAGKYPSYEHYAARIDEAAREREEQFKRMLAAGAAPATSVERKDG